MPPRLRRYYGAGYLHFITTSCYRRQPLLSNPHDRDLFLRRDGALDLMAGGAPLQWRDFL